MIGSCDFFYFRTYLNFFHAWPAQKFSAIVRMKIFRAQSVREISDRGISGKAPTDPAEARELAGSYERGAAGGRCDKDDPD